MPRIIRAHTTKHTGIGWLAIEGVDPYEICRYAGITMEVFEEVCAHHHPDFVSGVREGLPWRTDAESPQDRYGPIEIDGFTRAPS